MNVTRFITGTIEEVDGTLTTYQDGEIVRQQWSAKKVAAFNKRVHPDSRMRQKIYSVYRKKYGDFKPADNYPTPSIQYWVSVNGKDVMLKTPMQNLNIGFGFATHGQAAAFADKVGGQVEGTVYWSCWYPLDGSKVRPEDTNYRELQT